MSASASTYLQLVIKGLLQPRWLRSRDWYWLDMDLNFVLNWWLIGVDLWVCCLGVLSWRHSTGALPHCDIVNCVCNMIQYRKTFHTAWHGQRWGIGGLGVCFVEGIFFMMNSWFFSNLLCIHNCVFLRFGFSTHGLFGKLNMVITLTIFIMYLFLSWQSH